MTLIADIRASVQPGQTTKFEKGPSGNNGKNGINAHGPLPQNVKDNLLVMSITEILR